MAPIRPPPARLLVRLVPTAPAPTPIEPPSSNDIVKRVVVSIGIIGAIAALLYALSTIQPPPKPKRKRRRRRPR